MKLQFDPKYERGLIHAVVGDPPLGIFYTSSDLATAATVAREVAGYVIALPIVADMRPITWTENPDLKALERWMEEGNDTVSR